MCFFGRFFAECSTLIEKIAEMYPAKVAFSWLSYEGICKLPRNQEIVARFCCCLLIRNRREQDAAKY